MFFSEKERCETLAEYITGQKATVRQCATHFGISKSTVHKDVTGRLYYVNRRLFEEVKTVLEQNKSERHLRGGEATRQKYIKRREIIEKHLT